MATSERILALGVGQLNVHPTNITVIEAEGPRRLPMNRRRYYKAYLADDLAGKWSPLAANIEHPFAGFVQACNRFFVRPMIFRIPIHGHQRSIFMKRQPEPSRRGSISG